MCILLYYHNLSAMEEKILTDAVDNSKEWFNKQKMSRIVLKHQFF
jgi:hypothetical protein